MKASRLTVGSLFAVALALGQVMTTESQDSTVYADTLQNYPKIANVDGYSHLYQSAAMLPYDLLIANHTPDGTQGVAQVKSEDPGKKVLMYVSSDQVYIGSYQNGLFGSLSVYPGWWLTLAGTTLTNAISATATTIQVQDAQVIQANLSTNPFILVDGESMLVTSVDTLHNTVTVVRGICSSPTSHSAGVRVAVHAGDGPQFWRVNVTPYCPQDPTTGLTWDQYLVKQTLSELAGAPWDGIFLDDFGSSVASYNRGMIDANNDNSPDGGNGPSGTGWADGMASISTQFHTSDPGLVIVANSRDNTPNVEGEELEHFNPTSYWTQEMSQYLHGSGPDAVALGGMSIVNMDTNNTGIQSLQAMRFGLGSALLGNGYYAYDYGSNVHGNTWWYDEYDNGAGSSLTQPIGPTDTTLQLAPSTGSKFHVGDVVMVPDTGYDQENDEQMLVVGVSGDNLQVQRGYNNTTPSSHGIMAKVMTQAQLQQGLGWLGQPTDSAYEPSLSSPNLVKNGDFSNGTSGWIMAVTAPASANFSVTSSSTTDGSPSSDVQVHNADPASPWYASLYEQGISITAGQTYTLSYNVKSSNSMPVTVLVQEQGGDYHTLASQTSESNSTWTTQTLTFTADESVTNAKVQFVLGASAGEVSIGKVSLQQGDPNVWRRDFTNGTVIVNATGQTQTVQVGSGYRHLAGTQDAQINNGQPATSVTIQSHDAILLVRD